MNDFLGLGLRVTGYEDSEYKAISEISSLRNYQAIESFCGPGGMSLGLGWAGFNVNLAFDIDEPSVATHKRNLKGECFQADARNVCGIDLLAKAGLHVGDLALFAGGPPCQGFSKQRRGGHLADDRNDLVLEYTRLVQETKPRYMLFENVAIFGQLRGKEHFAEMQLRLADYELTAHFYNAADYGLPQTRQRFIVVGRRKDQLGRFRIPSPTVSKWRTVGAVIETLPEPPNDCSVHPKFANHQQARITALNKLRFSQVPQGGGWQDISPELRLPCHQGADPSSGGWPDVYGRLRSNGQCPTITGGFDSFTRGRYGHPTQDRAITAREAARMQGFPDKFVFEGNRGDVRSQIGNVVPPPLAEAVGIEILRALLISDGLLKDVARPPALQVELDLVA